MSLWLALGAMTVIAAAIVGLPLLRRPSPSAERHRFDVAVYRAQLEELAREEERGLLEAQEAAAARLEVERRMLAADAEPAGPTVAALQRRPLAAGALLIAFVGISAALYWQTGRPDLPAHPFAARAERDGQLAAAPGTTSVDRLIAGLEERLAANPDDLEAWLRLARAYATTGRYEQAVATYRRAISAQSDVAALHSGLGEALVMTSGGTVTQAARDAFATALQREPGDPRARFYEGLWRVQRGELEPALEVWTALIADAPADAPWLGDLRERTTGLARELGRDPATVLPSVAASPGQDLEARAAELSARLEADPKDYQGWIALARTWDALGESARAKDALDQGAQAYTGAPFVQQQLQAAATELGVTLGGASSKAPRGPTAEQMRAASGMTHEEQAEMIRGMVSRLAARLEDQPDDLEGWRMLARSYRVLQQPQQSADAYRHVAEALPDDLDAQVDYADALLAAASPGTPLPAALTRQMARVLTLDPEHPSALFYLGQAAVETGDLAAARTHWQRLLTQIPAGAPERAQIQQMIDQLPAP